MKLLFVANNCEHPNEMHINNIRGFMNISTVDFFGPGYSTEKELKAGVQAYWEERGGYDALFLDFSFAMLQSEYLDIREAYHWHRYYMSDYNIFNAIRYADKIVAETFQIDTVKIVWYYFDTVKVSERWERCIQALLEQGFYFRGYGKEFVPEMEEGERIHSVGFSNRYREFSCKNEKKIISMPYQTASLQEWYNRPLEERPYDFVVPGSVDRKNNLSRMTIIEQLMNSRYSLYDQFYDRDLSYRMGKKRIECSLYKSDEDKYWDSKLKTASPYLNARLSRDSIAMWRENFSVSIRASKIGYTAGGLSRQIIRKYVEIPARGALLMSEDIPPLKNFGFIEGENIIVVTPENVIEICDELFQNPERMQDIADKGREMVFGKHTPEIHAKHTIASICAIQKGAFQGSRWENGEFIIQK